MPETVTAKSWGDVCAALKDPNVGQISVEGDDNLLAEAARIAPKPPSRIRWLLWLGALILALWIACNLAILIWQEYSPWAPWGTTSSPPADNELTAQLAWPIVAIVAIIVLGLIASKAISHGQNVELEWKVTSKVTGRLVLTKVEVKQTTRRPKKKITA